MASIRGFHFLFIIGFTLAVFAFGSREGRTAQATGGSEPGAAGQEIKPDYQDLGFADPDYRYSQVTSKENVGYETFFDTYTFRFSKPPGHEVYELTQDDLSSLYQWRSPKGVPWTAWAYGPDQGFKSHEAFTVRALTSAFVISDKALKKVVRFLVQKQGMEPADDIVQFFSTSEETPESLKGENPAQLMYRLSRWFREHVAASAFDIYIGITETFAWYTSPGYQKGALPAEIEDAMDTLKEGRFDDSEPWAYQEIQAVTERAAAMVKSGNLPELDGPYYSSASDMAFLEMENEFASLPFYKDLFDVLAAIQANPKAFPDHQARFEEVLKSYPGPKPYYLVNWAGRVFSDLKELEKYNDLGDDETIETEVFGEMLAGNYRDLAFTNLEYLKDEIEAFIQRWSDLQSSS